MASTYKKNSVSITRRDGMTSECLFNFESEYKSRMFFLLLGELAREIAEELEDGM